MARNASSDEWGWYPDIALAVVIIDKGHYIALRRLLPADIDSNTVHRGSYSASQQI